MVSKMLKSIKNTRMKFKFIKLINETKNKIGKEIEKNLEKKQKKI